MQTTSRWITAIPVLLGLNALVWLGFGALVAFNLHPALPDLPLLKAGLAAASLCLAASLLALAYWLSKRSRTAYFVTLGGLALIAVAFLFDDFGWIDFACLVLNLLPLALLLKARAWFLAAG